MRDMGGDNRNGLTVQDMRACGKIIKLMAKVHFGMFMAINMMDNGKEIRLMEKENTPTAMVRPTTETGRMTYSTVMEKNSGTIIPNMKESINVERNMEKELIPGKTGLNIMVSGMKIEFMDMVPIRGMMEGSMKAIGKIIIWMEKDCIHGKMVENMRGNIRKIKNTAMVHIPGRTAENTKANGQTADRTAEANISLKRVSSEKASGETEKENNGLMIIKHSITNMIDNILESNLNLN